MASNEAFDTSEFFPVKHRKGLFYSPAWITAWHHHWGNHPRLIALASPSNHQETLYRFKEFKKGILPVVTAIPAGASSRVARSIRAEYFCISTLSEPEAEVHSYLNNALSYKWSLLKIPDLLAGSREDQSIRSFAKAKGLLIVEENQTTTYAIDLRDTDFENYLTQLGKNTRLKIYNRRKRLADAGTVKLENIWPDRKRFYRLLNEFHSYRWGKPCYQGRNQAFIDELLQAHHEAGGQVQMSVLSLDTEPVSVVLDIISQGRCYNLQSGYQENTVKDVSLGTLHFGYRIEQAFSEGLDYYDFMAGNGKNCNYKASLSTHSATLATLLLIRSPMLKLAYHLKGML